MKQQIILFTLLMLCFSKTAQAKDYVIALSPMQSREALQKQIVAVVKFLAENVKPGENALLVDGLNLKTISQFKVKDSPSYDNPKAKLQLNRQAITALQQFGLQPHAIAKHGIAGVIQAPQLLEFLGRNYGAFKDTDIILIGSPIYVDSRHPDWGMMNNQYPGDGHFSASSQASPFSLSGRENLLNNTRIHWAYPDDSWITSDAYRVNVTRVWSLLAEGYGSKLSTFTGDLTTLWRRAAMGAIPAPHGFQREYPEKIETIQLISLPQNSDSVSIYERALSKTPPSKQALRQAQNVEIGISWSCESCDIDLYVRPHHGADILSFSNRRTKEGHYHKDFTKSPKTEGGYETVTLTSTVDLHDMLIAINWYGGQSSSGVKGEIRLAIGDKTYGLPFEFSGKAGNRGAGKEKTVETRRAVNSNWLVVDPVKSILGV